MTPPTIALAPRHAAGGMVLSVETARAILSKARRVDEAKDIRDKAEALRIYHRQQTGARDAQNDAAEIKLRAERRIGELLAEQRHKKARAGPGRPQNNRGHRAPISEEPPPTLEELGIDLTAAKRWRAAARVPEERFEEYVAEVRKDPHGELTSIGIQKLAKSRASVAAAISAESDDDERFTPRALVVELHELHAFTVDAASCDGAPSSKVIGRFWAKDDDGLEESWRGERVWCNPPFSALSDWVAKADREVREGGCPLAILLMPANRADQPFWQELIEPHRDGRGSGPVTVSTRFLGGRQRFGSPADLEGERSGSPSFGCVLVKWEAAALERPKAKRVVEAPRCRICGGPCGGDICYPCSQKEARDRKAAQRAAAKNLIVDVEPGESEEAAEKRHRGSAR